MKLARNFSAGLANSAWSVVIGLVAVPFYIKYLGIETYGLIGFFVTIQALLHLLDMGMTPTINREVARHSSLGNIKEAGKLLHTLAIIYWFLAGMAALLIMSIAPWVASYWLQSTLSIQTISNAVFLMGVVVVFRLPFGLYQGALIGAQRLTITSSINMIMVTTGSLGAVFILAFISPTIEAFFLWQACVAVVFAFIVRLAAWRIIGKTKITKFDFDRLKGVWSFTAGMSVVSLSGMILMQLDKVMLSKILDLEDFARYTLAIVVSNCLYIFLTPLFNVIYPRMTALVATGDRERLIILYRTGTIFFLSLFMPIAIYVATFSEEIIFIWTGDMNLAVSVSPVASFFLLGTMLNGAMHFPYSLQLAYGKTQLPVIINIVLIIIMIPTILILALSYGAIGGAAAWAITNFMYLLFGAWLTHRTLLQEIGIKWLCSDVALPLLISILVVGIGGWLIQYYNHFLYLKLIAGCFLVPLSFLAVVLLSSRLREAVKNLRNNNFGGSILD